MLQRNKKMTTTSIRTEHGGGTALPSLLYVSSSSSHIKHILLVSNIEQVKDNQHNQKLCENRKP